MPDLIRYQQRERIENQTGVARQARRSFDEPNMGDVVSIAGEALGRIEEARAAAEVTKASLATREALTRFERDLAQRPDLDPEDFERVFREGSEKIVRQQTEALGSRTARDVFALRAQELRTDHGLRVDALARARSADRARAKAAEIGDVFAQMARDPSNSEDDVAEAYESYRKVIERQTALGIYSEEDAQALSVVTDETLRESKHNRHVHDIDRLLESGRYAEAEGRLNDAIANDEILPEKRDALRDEVAGQGRERQAMVMVDSFEDRGLTAAEIREEIRGIEDPEMRQMVERRRDYMMREREAAQIEAAEEVYEKHGDAIWAGRLTSVMNIPRSDREKLTQGQLSALQTLIERRAQGGPDAQTSPAAVAAFNDTLLNKGPEAAKTLLMDSIGAYSRSDWQRYYEMATRSQAAAASGQTSPDIDVLRTRQEQVTYRLGQLGMDDKDGMIAGAIHKELDVRAQRWAVENGVEKAPDQVVQQIIGELAGELVTREYDQIPWWPGTREKQFLPGAPEFADDTVVPEEFQSLVAQRFAGQTVTQEQLDGAYMEAIEELRRLGAEPDYQAVTEMLEYYNTQARSQ